MASRFWCAIICCPCPKHTSVSNTASFHGPSASGFRGLRSVVLWLCLMAPVATCCAGAQTTHIRSIFTAKLWLGSCIASLASDNADWDPMSGHGSLVWVAWALLCVSWLIMLISSDVHSACGVVSELCRLIHKFVLWDHVITAHRVYAKNFLGTTFLFFRLFLEVWGPVGVTMTDYKWDCVLTCLTKKICWKVCLVHWTSTDVQMAWRAQCLPWKALQICIYYGTS